MPPVEVAALGDEAIGAGRRQPGDLVDALDGQLDAVRHGRLAVFIVLAATALPVEQATGDRREHHVAGVPVLELVETAQAAAVAQPLPFGKAHLGQALGLPVG
ncbi:hypothetical protein D3C72_2072880 [compost metagenome]